MEAADPCNDVRISDGFRRRAAWRVAVRAEPDRARGLEARLGLRLLTRTTRRVAPTEAEDRLLHAAGPRLDEIEAEMAAPSELRDKSAGTIRITARDHAVRAVLWPALDKFLPDYPDIKLEIVIDYGLTEVVAEASTPAFVPERWWQRTWSPCTSGRTCAQRSSARGPISPSGQGQRRHKT
jgi:hypothetical protein